MFPLVRSTLSYADLTTPYFNLDIYDECMNLTTKGNRPSTYMCEENRVDLDNEWYYPCGYLPYSVFTDTFQLMDNNNVSVPLLTDAASLNIPRQYHDDFVQEQKGAVNWLCPRIFPLAVKDPHFVVWTLPYDGPVASRPWGKFTVTEETSLPLRVSS
ncbi:MAG: uncharacterized protein KVP18_002470 [Porospora cf. gigantea A]|uniref:uncharacterized protein n=1 Tax=Porospora cf. gigantea A TaxID=2853593 RepID=UPI00355A2DF5|nr:MAG: hypothetical protein KVP18_002470 [Porospora cf. gigantea A]